MIRRLKKLWAWLVDPYYGEWMASPMVCDKCGHKCMVVHPSAERVECSQCHYMNQVPPVQHDD